MYLICDQCCLCRCRTSPYSEGIVLQYNLFSIVRSDTTPDAADTKAVKALC